MPSKKIFISMKGVDPNDKDFFLAIADEVIKLAEEEEAERETARTHRETRRKKSVRKKPLKKP